MSVRVGLERARDILMDLSNRPDCAEITGYDGIALRIFATYVDRAIRRYKREAKRIRKYYP